jgi:nitrogen fixation protein FixH
MKWQDGRPLSVQEVMLQFSQPALNVEPFDVYLSGSGGNFSAPNYALPLSGQWQVETRILVEEYSLLRVVFRISLAAS